MGADSGLDGYIYFIDDKSGIAKKIVVQVKSGHPYYLFRSDTNSLGETMATPLYF